MLYFVLKYGLIIFSIWFLWGLRNYIRSPWGTYISHTRISNNSLFVKVKHYSVWPPWRPYIATWFKQITDRWWHEKKW